MRAHRHTFRRAVGDIVGQKEIGLDVVVNLIVGHWHLSAFAREESIAAYVAFGAAQWL